MTWEQSQRKEPQPPPEDVACELERLGLNPDEFLRAVLDFPGTFRRMLGPVAALAGRAAECGRGWMHGVRRAARLFRGPCSRWVGVYVRGLYVRGQRSAVMSAVSGCSIMLSQSEKIGSPAWVWIGLEDDSLFHIYRSCGVKVVQEPRNYSWTYEMKFADIDGNVLWLGTEFKPDTPIEDQKKD